MSFQSQPTIVPVINLSQSARPESQLTTIPLEVLLQITSNLRTPDYGNFRLTCKNIEERLLNAFAREFFAKRQFMLTEFSLRALIEISKSRFSDNLTHIIIGLERPSLQNMHQTSNRLSLEYADHVTLIQSGQDVEMLSTAFSNLRNLETVALRDFNSFARRRDYPKIEWRSYGCRTFEQDTGHRLQILHKHEFTSGIMSLDKTNYLGQVFLSILRAIGKSSSQPQKFEAILRNISLFDHFFNLPNYLLPTIQPKLEHIRTLLLDLNSMFPCLQVDETNPSTSIPSYHLRKFLAKTPNLEHLRLNFAQYSRMKDSKNLLLWLAAPVTDVASDTLTDAAVFEIPPTINLCKLNQLDIGRVELEPQVLLAVIRKFGATLKTLSLHRVCLYPDTTNHKKVNLWAKLFTQLSDIDVDLSAINMSSLSQKQFRGTFVLSTSPSVTFNDSRNQYSRKWAGSNMKSALRDFASQVIVNCLPSDEDGDNDESMSGSDEDHDEEDEDSEDDEDGIDGEDEDEGES